MNVGLLLDNINYPADSSFDKLAAMHSSCVGLLFTAGTKHRRAVYDRCENILDSPSYIVRVGGHRQTAAEWLQDARGALAEVPDVVLAEGRVSLVCGNEPNIEFGGPVEYGQLYAAVKDSSVPVLFACPSLGVDGWGDWLSQALAAAGNVQRGIVNLYAENVGLIAEFTGMFPELHIGEVNSPPWMHDGQRVEFMGQAFSVLAWAGVKSTLIFISGGVSQGAWDEGYILSLSEAQGIGALGDYSGGGTMSELEQDAKINQILAQNALLTQAIKAFRTGQFSGAAGLDGIYVALTGAPIDYEPSYPPLA